MNTACWSALVAVAALLADLTAQDSPWRGTWFTTRGVLELEVSGRTVTGRYGQQDATLRGELDDGTLRYTATEGRARLEGELELGAGGFTFRGPWRTGRQDGTWSGWREDPTARQGRDRDVAGAWRTSWGLLELEQDGERLTGGYGAQGWSHVEGTIDGRHVELRYENPFGTGAIAFDVVEDGSWAFGHARSDRGRWPLQCQRLVGYAKNVAPVPGELVQGLADNRLTYYLRAPAGWQKGSDTPLLVFLHGSNMSARPYAQSIAASGLADGYVIVGIDGERWQDGSRPDDPRHDYSYVNFMGRSTYEGYPNTHRESPALVAELIESLVAQTGCPRVFVGGHSQGGFLSWFLAMHYPELVSGIFPMSCGMVMQCEPDVFADERLRAAQRQVAIAVVHGRNDRVVPFSQGHGAYLAVLEHGFPRLRLFTSRAGHGFSSLPWQDAVRWLERMTGDGETLAAFGQAAADDGDWRTAAAVARTLRQHGGAEAGDALMARIDAACRDDAARFAAAIAASRADGSDWIDDFLAFRDDFEFADAAQAAMTAFVALRAEHDPRAEELVSEARELFREGDRDGGYGKYEELVARCFASSLYRRAKGWLEDRR